MEGRKEIFLNIRKPQIYNFLNILGRGRMPSPHIFLGELQVKERSETWPNVLTSFRKVKPLFTLKHDFQNLEHLVRIRRWGLLQDRSQDSLRLSWPYLGWLRTPGRGHNQWQKACLSLRVSQPKFLPESGCRSQLQCDNNSHRVTPRSWVIALTSQSSAHWLSPCCVWSTLTGSGLTEKVSAWLYHMEPPTEAAKPHPSQPGMAQRSTANNLCALLPCLPPPPSALSPAPLMSNVVSKF